MRDAFGGGSPVEPFFDRDFGNAGRERFALVNCCGGELVTTGFWDPEAAQVHPRDDVIPGGTGFAQAAAASSPWSESPSKDVSSPSW